MKRFLVVLLVAYVLSGCSAFRDQTQQVKLACPMPDTLVLVDGKRVACPSTLDMPRDRSFTVQAYREGRLPITRTISYHLSDAGQADILGTFVFLLPVIGLAAPGAWDLDADEIELTMLDPKAAAQMPITQPAAKEAPAPKKQGSRVNPETGALIQD